MIPCSACQTLNPDGQSTCLACGGSLDGTHTRLEDTSGRTVCENGHTIDPNWSRCPYCARGAGAASSGSRATRLEETGLTEAGASPTAGARRATRLEPTTHGPVGADPRKQTRLAGEGAEAPAPPPSPTVRSPGPRPTRLEESRAPQRQTVLRPVQTAAPAAEPGPTAPPLQSDPGSSRRLVGVLAAPDLRPGGVVFPLREGKNRIGTAEGYEICLGEDPETSGDHALLLYRGGTFRLADRMSTNGTWVNGEELAGTDAVRLSDRDRIRCGNTDLVLLVLSDGESRREARSENDSPSD